MILLSVVFVFWRVVDDHPGRCSEPDEIYAGNRNRLIAVLSNKDLRMVCLGFSCLNYVSCCNPVWVPSYLHVKIIGINRQEEKCKDRLSII